MESLPYSLKRPLVTLLVGLLLVMVADIPLAFVTLESNYRLTDLPGVGTFVRVLFFLGELGVVAWAALAIVLALSAPRRLYGRAALCGLAAAVAIWAMPGVVFYHSPAAVQLTASGFSRQSIDILSGEFVRFINVSSAPQRVCMGVDERCVAGGGPAALQPPGLSIAPGQTIEVTFDGAAYYHLTSASVPHANVLVTVSQHGGGCAGCGPPPVFGVSPLRG